MSIQTTAFGSFTAVDLAAQGFGKIKLTVSYSHPATLRWVMHAPQESFPLGIRTFVKFWDDAGTNPATSTAWSSTNPIFEGFIEEVQPREANLIEYVAYDPTYRAGQEIAIMSINWPQGNVGTGTPPQPHTSAVPRLIMNSKIDNDDDYAFQRGGGSLTVGNMLATVFEDEYHPLYWMNAAPGDGTSAGNNVPYVAADCDAMTLVPQEKIVFQSETVRAAVDRLVAAHYPQYKLLWHPLSSNADYSRKWRFKDVKASTERTVTLNQFDNSNDVLSMELGRSIERRFTAVKFYGPETLTLTVASTLDGTLAPVGYYTVLETLGISTEIRAYQNWQITNPNRRRMGRILPTPVMVPVGGYQWMRSFGPTLQASWDNGATWITVAGAYFDYRDGIASIAPAHLFFWTSQGVIQQTGIQHYFPPNAFRLVYAYFDTPLSVRYPTSGYSGTAYDVANISHEKKIYDEMLAIGYERGTPVTSAIRLAQYSTLAQQMHTEAKDIIYTGGMTFDGIEYDWVKLDRRCNIAAVDGDGNSVTTGWEAIGALVTDVEYDFDERITTIQFSSDQQELLGIDPEEMKWRLGIRALERRSQAWTRFLFVPFRSEWSWRDNTAMRMAGIESGVNITYVDPETGEVHSPI